MPQPADIEQIERPLVDAYQRAASNIRAELQALADDPVRGVRRARLGEMLGRIDEELRDIAGQSKLWASRSLPTVYALGGADGVFQVGNGGEFVWSQIHREAVQVLATRVYTDLLEATQHVRADTKRLIRDVVKDRALQKTIEGKTAKQAGVEMRRVLERRGVNAVVYANGSVHGIAEYSQMSIRTATALAYNEGTINGAAGEGTKYFEVFDGPLCGWTFHNDPDLANGKIVDRTDALTYTISHPNCRRAFGARPDVRSKAQAKKAERSVTDAQNADQTEADLANSAAGKRRAAKRARDVRTRTALSNGRIGQIEAALDDARGRLRLASGPKTTAKIRDRMAALRRERDRLRRAELRDISSAPPVEVG